MQPSKRDEKMMAEGWWPVALVATRLGVSPSTVYRWVDDAAVVQKEVMGKKYVSLESVVAHVGPEAAHWLQAASRASA